MQGQGADRDMHEYMLRISELFFRDVCIYLCIKLAPDCNLCEGIFSRELFMQLLLGSWPA